MDKNYLQCSVDKWSIAQAKELEVWEKSKKDGEDWNEWWFNHFNGYHFLSNKTFKFVIELGCGPYAKNYHHIAPLINPRHHLTLLDPLLNNYMEKGFSVKYTKGGNFTPISKPIEGLIPTINYDLIICINVLDHVYNADLCMDIMSKLLNPGGCLIIGQDLSDKKDIEKTHQDIMHPIKIDLEFFDYHLKQYKTVFKKILAREEGRNPSAHYATLLYTGQKVQEYD